MDSAGTIDEAITLTDRLRAAVSSDSVDAFLDRPEASEAYAQAQRAGFDPSEFLIGGSETLNMAIANPVKRFFAAYVRQVHASICDPHGDLRSKVSTAIGGGTGSVLMCLGAALAVPAAAVVLLAPIAAVLLVIGIDAFCTMDHEQSATT